MPQQTNLNVAPYFDDYDASDDFYRVLFKAGFPVQARELTTLQSILQNQIEKFGQHFFKEGAKVILEILDIINFIMVFKYKIIIKVFLYLHMLIN